MKLTIVEKNLLSWTAMHIDFVMCNNVVSYVGSGRFGNKMAEDVSATFCCRNVFGAETSSQQVKDVSATFCDFFLLLKNKFSLFVNVSQNFQYFPLLMWGHIRCMHARPHRRKDQLPLRSLRDLRFR